MIEQAKQLMNNNSNLNSNLLKSVILKKFYENNNIEVYLKPNSNSPISQKQKIQDNLLFSGSIEQGQYFSYYPPQSVLQNTLSSEQSLHSYVNSLKQQIGNSFGMNSHQAQDSIVVMRVELNKKKNIPIDFCLKNKNSQHLKAKNQSIFIKNLIENAEISPDYFNSRYDTEWQYQNYIEYRGALPFSVDGQSYIPKPQPYYFPIGFRGYGLNVENKYGSNNNWISMNSDINTWIVLFHGTPSTNIKPILESYLIPGKQNAYQGQVCRITQEKICFGQQNVYLSDKVEVSEGYCKYNASFNGCNYAVVFQCRVNPFGVRSPISRPDYYTVQNSYEDIRPYRLLIKMEQQQNLNNRY